MLPSYDMPVELDILSCIITLLMFLELLYHLLQLKSFYQPHSYLLYHKLKDKEKSFYKAY